MGAVFQATHLGTTRPVALKVIVPQLAENQEFAQRFKREAEAAGRLIHPNVVNVTDFGVTQVGEAEVAYLVMEYLDGQSLADFLKENVRPAFGFLLDVIDQTGLALDASHAAGIVHRDLKPSNIWLEPNHRGGYNVKVLDFGIAKIANPTKEERAIAADSIATVVMVPSDANSSLALAFSEGGNPATPSNLKTSAGTLLGTPAYMAPEQCAGIEVDALADVYSLAAIAYQMLCGRLPFEAESMRELIRQHVQTVPQSPRKYDATVPQALAEVVLSGLEKDPQRRPPTAGTFSARLRASSEGELPLLRKSKDVFHTNSGVLLSMLVACVSVVVVGMIPLQFAASWAARSKLAPDGVLFAIAGVGGALFMLFGFQLFKAACALMLRNASEQKQFQLAGRRALRTLLAGFFDLLRTQLLSAIDMRPSSWWANILWPVVWATEGRSGKDAIKRSRQLCSPLRPASIALSVRQYGPVLLGSLAFPAVMSVTDPSGAALHALVREVLTGSALGWFVLLYPLIFGIMLASFGPAYSFLYWSGLRWRNEGAEIELPAAARDDRRKSASAKWRPATRIWALLPALLLVAIAFRANTSAHLQAMNEASSDGRRAALLKLIDGGLSVEQLTGAQETALFEAVRSGDDKLVAGLLQRGAKVNDRGNAANTPLLVAAKYGRTEIARVLLDSGALVDAPNREGRTPLIVATMRGNTALIRLLLERGADAAHSDAHAKTAAAYAAEEGHGELEGLLSRKQHP